MSIIQSDIVTSSKLARALNVPTEYTLKIDENTTKTFSVKVLSILQSAKIRDRIVEYKDGEWRKNTMEMAKMLEPIDRPKFIIQAQKEKPQYDDVSTELFSTLGIKLVVCEVLKIDIIDFEKIINIPESHDILIKIFYTAVGLEDSPAQSEQSTQPEQPTTP